MAAGSAIDWSRSRMAKFTANLPRTEWPPLAIFSGR
jgi:hypothetical protein